MSNRRKQIVAAAEMATDAIRNRGGAGLKRAESTETAVWLVGLSLGLAALLLGAPGSAPGLPAWARFLIVLLLYDAVVLGVIHRIFMVTTGRRWERLRAELDGYLLGYLEALRFEPAEELSETWDAQAIVTRLRDEFGTDYSLLLRYEIPLDEYRRLYRRECDSWSSYESEVAGHLVDTTMAYVGIGDDAVLKAIVAPTDPATHLRDVRARSARAIKMLRIADWCFVIACMCFLLALLLGGFVLVLLS